MSRDVKQDLKFIRVEVDTCSTDTRDTELRPLAKAIIYVDRHGTMILEFDSGAPLHCMRIDEDNCPVFGWFGKEFPHYAIHYPDGGEDWTVQSILEELRKEEEEPEPEELELTFAFITEDALGNVKLSDIICVTQVVQR